MKKSTKWIIFLLLIALVGCSVFFVLEQLQRNAAANREEQLQWRLQIHLDEMGRSVERIDPIRPDNWPDVDTWQFAVTFVDEPELVHVFTEVDGGSGGWRLLSTEGEEGESGVEENDQSITEMPDAPLTDGQVEEADAMLPKDESEIWRWLYEVGGHNAQGEPFRIWIPELTADNPAFEEINQEIKDRFAYDIPEYLASGENFINVTSRVSEREGILSLMLLREEYPIYGTDPVRWAATVDLVTGESITLEEMLERIGKDSDSVLAQTRAAAESQDVALISMEQFYYAEDGSLQIILQVEEFPQGADPWIHYWLYDVEKYVLLS